MATNRKIGRNHMGSLEGTIYLIQNEIFMNRRSNPMKMTVFINDFYFMKYALNRRKPQFSIDKLHAICQSLIPCSSIVK
jgi:hypothetical protein